MAKLPPPSVFVSIRGDESCLNFIRHLEKALGDEKVPYFIHNLFRSGDLAVRCNDIFGKYQFKDSITHVKEIEDSELALAVFCQRYPQSTIALNNLVKIVEEVKADRLKVIPVFYKVSVEDVKHWKGDFGQNLFCGGRREMSNVLKWANALRYVAAENGLTSENYSNESDFIVDIVVAVKKVLAGDVQGLEELFVQTRLQVVAEPERAAESPQGILRTPDTVPKVRNEKDKLECTDELGDLVKTVDNDLALKIHTKAATNPEVVAEGKEFGKTPIYSREASPPQQHQVFINFRGELRNNFVSHLVEALRRNEINVFIDNQELRGEEIGILLNRIEESVIALVVFSTGYTESRWCLREAAKIKDCVENGTLKVLPIFYKVTTSNVKQLKGEFGDHFRDREWENRFDKPQIEQWKKALAFISGRFGQTFDGTSPESDFIELIVKDVLRMLASIDCTN
ncbi:unnamed protein product [Microthlaspi erraticum]|uniref:TIR domain-containing protein n=1 Tax=Microthlaspi erraticum TaxID=1685480 RepID=A0A6D2HPB7_9BRAS|nr:unnamed protein product [Microthlaspi erraticum]